MNLCITYVYGLLVNAIDVRKESMFWEPDVHLVVRFTWYSLLH